MCGNYSVEIQTGKCGEVWCENVIGSGGGAVGCSWANWHDCPKWQIDKTVQNTSVQIATGEQIDSAAEIEMDTSVEIPTVQNCTAV
jgi:hypothetical protein